jgi:tubulin-specific chaperone E
LEALKFKYDSGTMYDTKKSSGVQQKPITISGKEVEEIGFDKIKKLQSRLNELRIVYLDGLLISQPGNVQARKAGQQEHDPGVLLGDEILRTCPKINTLDLARNLLESVEEVAFICQNLRQLRELRLT